jgi:hypothetical protein
MTTKHPFFTKVQELAEQHGVVAYVLVSAVTRDDAIVIATSAGTKLKEEHAVTKQVYESMENAFERGMSEIIREEEPRARGDDEPPEGGLLN